MMATDVVCSVVHLTHTPPVPVLLDGMAVPRPLHARCSPMRRMSDRPRLGAAFRHWGRTPSLPPPSQVKPWALNPEVEEELRESLVVMGPSNVVGGTTGVKSQLRAFAGRALTAPPASLSSSLGGGVEDHQPRDDPKTPQSSTLSFKDLVPRSTEDAVTVFPVRPPISGGKSIPGRLFTRPALTEDQADQLGYFQHAKPPALPSRPHSWFSPGRRSGSRAGRTIDLSLCVTSHRFLYAPGPVFNQRGDAKSQQLYLQDIVLRPRIFTIHSKRNPDSSLAKNDVTDSQWADFTASTKRLKTPQARLGPTAEFKDVDFAVVLQGHRKHLHTKPIPDPDQPGVPIEDCGEELVMGSDNAINILPRGQGQPHIGGTETTAGQSDTTGTLANIHKDAFPELS